MRGSAEGDALDRLVSSQLPSVLCFATRLTRDPDRAEELVAEALGRVAKTWKSFRGEAEFRTWLWRIVINVFRDGLRKAAPPEQLDEDPADTRAADPARQAEADELGRFVASRISALPPRQREVVVLLVYEKETPAEAARLLNTSEQNVYALLHAARQRLRTELAPHVLEK